MQEVQHIAVSITRLLLEEAEKTAPAGVLEWDQYQDMRRRIIASVEKFATMPTQAIEAMPVEGVRGLAESHSELYTLITIVKSAAKDDEAWASLREEILGRLETARATH